MFGICVKVKIKYKILLVLQTRTKRYADESKVLILKWFYRLFVLNLN